MTSTINAATSSGGGVITTADASGTLALQGAGVTALTVTSAAVTANVPMTITSGAISGATINNSVIGGTTAVAGSFSTLSASGTVSGAGFNPFMAALFGTGSDGDVTITGTVTLTRDMNYRFLTISGAGQLITNACRVFVSNTLDITAAPAGAIRWNSPAGNNASGATGGTYVGFGNGAGTTPGLAYSTNSGGTGNTGTGTNGSNSIPTNSYNFSSGAGGAGGAGGNGVSVGAAGIAATVLNSGTLVYASISQTFLSLLGGNSPVPLIVQPSLTGGGGGQGGGDGVNAGGGGGSPSPGAGMVYIAARNINRGASTAVGAIAAKSGNGGNGADGVAGTAGGGGGAGAGSGGTVIVIAGALLGATGTNAIDVSGGTGGNGGNCPSINKGGTGGRGGGAGAAYIHVLSPASYTAYTPGTAGTAAVVATTTAGTVGGAGVTARTNL